MEESRHRGVHRQHPQPGERLGDPAAEVPGQPGEDPADHGHVGGRAAVQARRAEVDAAGDGGPGGARHQPQQGDRRGRPEDHRARQREQAAAEAGRRGERRVAQLRRLRRPDGLRRLQQDRSLLARLLPARDGLCQVCIFEFVMKRKTRRFFFGSFL